jgi:ribosomal protein L18
MRNSIPLLLSIIILSFATNAALAQRPPAYMFGYSLALNSTTTSQCNIFAKTVSGTGVSLSTSDFDLCIAGFNNAQANTTHASTAYKTGYDLGKRDSMINTSDATSACRGFVTDVQWVCKQGYDKGYNDYANIIQSGDNK